MAHFVISKGEIKSQTVDVFEVDVEGGEVWFLKSFQILYSAGGGSNLSIDVVDGILKLLAQELLTRLLLHPFQETEDHYGVPIAPKQTLHEDLLFVDMTLNPSAHMHCFLQAMRKIYHCLLPGGIISSSTRTAHSSGRPENTPVLGSQQSFPILPASKTSTPRRTGVLHLICIGPIRKANHRTLGHT